MPADFLVTETSNQLHRKKKLDELWAFMYDKWTAHVQIFVALKAKAFGSENGARIFQHEVYTFP